MIPLLLLSVTRPERITGREGGRVVVVIVIDGTVVVVVVVVIIGA